MSFKEKKPRNPTQNQQESGNDDGEEGEIMMAQNARRVGSRGPEPGRNHKEKGNDHETEREELGDKLPNPTRNQKEPGNDDGTFSWV